MTDRLVKMLLAVAMLVCMVSISFSGDTANGKPKVEVIRLDGLVRDLPIQLRESWNAIGIDPNDNVYALFGGATDASSDGALFQFPGKDLLAALTLPNGDVMLYDPSGLNARGVGAEQEDLLVYDREDLAVGQDRITVHVGRGLQRLEPIARLGKGIVLLRIDLQQCQRGFIEEKPMDQPVILLSGQIPQQGFAVQIIVG